MFVREVESDSSGVPDPVTWADIEAAIRRLDGERCTELLLRGFAEDEQDVGPMMGVGGGGGHYLVWATTDGEDMHNLRNPDGDPSESVTFVAGGQRVRVRLSEVVDLGTALRAARAFAESGEIDPALAWGG
jgi:hypothetical protein